MPRNTLQSSLANIGREALQFSAVDKLTSTFVSTAGQFGKAAKGPDEMLGQLFEDVQRQNILGDSKVFADLVPKKRIKAIRQEYLLAKRDPDFNLQEFINRHFYEFDPSQTTKRTYTPQAGLPVREHIRQLWRQLERRNRRDRGSLLALPHPYIVPGGRFEEQFYWDSYFIMLGLAADDRWDMIENMMKNYRFMIRKYGFIPTANRSYFLSRSQPPMFALMVQLLADHHDKTLVYLDYLPYLLAEYRFWTKGKQKLSRQQHKAYLRIVAMPDGSYMGRYYDNKKTPRPESLWQDETTAKNAEDREAGRVYLHLRAAAESGWDFSSRWFIDPRDIETIHTADIIPVDLNCLLYELELTIARSYRAMKNVLLARKFERLARQRKAAIMAYCWDDKEGVFRDYNFHHHEQASDLTLAMVYPLFVGIATDQQASRVAEMIEHRFLKSGGLVTTLVDSGQQWDSPNGWAPLHWIAISGLRRYGYDELAREIKRRWVATNLKVYRYKQKLIEKYDVEGKSGLGGGGEYPLQDGFGWTNGVLAMLLDEGDAP